MDVLEKLTILTDSAKYDVACTSSGSERPGGETGLGSTVAAGLCHAFAADGRCISLLKVLLSNCCVYDCKYCVNRVTNDVPRAAFTPRELADLTIGFYRRNYIEGLFLSSAVLRSPDYTMEQMIGVLELLRGEYRFRGYIHAKAIPGADPALVARLGLLADRISINIELPSERSLSLLAPDKSKRAILAPMKQVSQSVTQSKAELMRYRKAPQFAPAGQSTQMIIGASPETDYQILRLTEGLYQKYSLKRVFFSAYIPVAEDSLLPALDTKPPLLREHRLYQADWLLRFYQFSASEILDVYKRQICASVKDRPVSRRTCSRASSRHRIMPSSRLRQVPALAEPLSRRIMSTVQPPMSISRKDGSPAMRSGCIARAEYPCGYSQTPSTVTSYASPSYRYFTGWGERSRYFLKLPFCRP